MNIDLYVSLSGSDKNDGTKESPFESLTHAFKKVSELKELNKVTIYLRAGKYSIDKTIVLSNEIFDGHIELKVCSFEHEKVTFSGTREIKCKWEKVDENIFCTKVDSGVVIDQFYVNDKRQQMSRFPKYDKNVLPYNGYSSEVLSEEKIKTWVNPKGAYLHAMHVYDWGGYHYKVAGKNEKNELYLEGGWQNNRQMGMHKDYKFIENIFEEITDPGDWSFNQDNSMLYYYPHNDIELHSSLFEYSHLNHIFEFNGEEQCPVQNIEISGIEFINTNRTFMETKEPLLRSDWAIYRGGAILFNGAKNCRIEGCDFNHIGGNGIFVSKFNQNIQISNCHFYNIGASAICFVGDPKCVRNPLFEYAEKQNYHDLNLTPGPDGENFPSDCLVDNCLIHEISTIEKQATGVQISMSKNIKVRHCSIYDTGRAGININEGTFGGHIIEYCDVFDTVRETGDHGSFNSWGRDRFWELDEVPEGKLSELALLDVEKNIIRNSRWRCDRGWDIDLDDGSSNYEIYNNLCLRGGIKLREGFYRKVYNNICINSSFHLHVWYKDSKDVIQKNIWMRKHKPIRLNGWGDQIDYNFYTNESDQKAFAEHGCDENSLFGDPLFVDPKHGDYRVSEESSVLKTGFENFEMDKFGVQSERLKVLAKTPIFPMPILTTENSGEQKKHLEEWMNAKITELSGEEFSAFGVSKEDGGVHVFNIKSDSLLAKSGLAKGDLIQFINDIRINNIEKLKSEFIKEESNIEIGVVRNQQNIKLKLN